MRDKSRWLIIVVLVVAAAVLQGCDLSEKEIDDIYTAVEEVLAGVEQKEIGIAFPRPYCFLSAPVSWRGKLTQSSPPPSLGFLRFEHCVAASSTCSTFASFPMSFASDGTIPDQGSTLAGRCFAPNDWMNVYFTPVGGNVQAGAFLHFNFRYNVSGDGSPVDERILIVVVSADEGATGKVKVTKDKLGKEECALPGPNPNKPNRNACQFLYDVPDEGRELTAGALRGNKSSFKKWGDLCKPSGQNPVCDFLFIENLSEVSAKFDLVK